MTHRHDPKNSPLPVYRVHNPKAPDPVLPEPLQLPDQWIARIRVGTQRAQGGFDASFEIGREVSDGLSYMRRDVRPEGSLHRRRFGGRRGSPKRSSKDRPRFPDL